MVRTRANSLDITKATQVQAHMTFLAAAKKASTKPKSTSATKSKSKTKTKSKATPTASSPTKALNGSSEPLPMLQQARRPYLGGIPAEGTLVPQPQLFSAQDFADFELAEPRHQVAGPSHQRVCNDVLEAVATVEIVSELQGDRPDLGLCLIARCLQSEGRIPAHIHPLDFMQETISLVPQGDWYVIYYTSYVSFAFLSLQSFYFLLCTRVLCHTSSEQGSGGRHSGPGHAPGHGCPYPLQVGAGQTGPGGEGKARNPRAAAGSGPDSSAPAGHLRFRGRV